MNTPSFRTAFRCCECLRSNVSRQPLSQRRTFTSSHILRKSVLPKFAPTSSPELDTILLNLRNKVFLPAILTREQQKIIHSPKYKTRLETEPITVTIGGETIRLEHIDITKDVPRSRSSLVKAAHLMKDRNDWNNLPPLLEGLRLSGTKIGYNHHIFLVHEAQESGHLDVIIECARRVSSTGFALDNVYIVRGVMRTLHKMAFGSDWQAVGKALRWAELVNDMIQSDTHRGQNSLSTQLSLRSDLANTGCLLSLAAMRAKKLQDGKDTDGKVALYAKDVLKANLELDDIPDAAESKDSGPREEQFLNVLVAVHGLKEAGSVLGPGSTVGSKASKKANEVIPRLAAQYEQIMQRETTMRDKDKPVLRLCEKLLGLESR